MSLGRSYGQGEVLGIRLILVEREGNHVVECICFNLTTVISGSCARFTGARKAGLRNPSKVS